MLRERLAPVTSFEPFRDARCDIPVQVEEEHNQMECQLNEALLLVYIQLSEDLSRIKQVLILHNLLSVPGKQWQVKDQGDPVPVDKEQDGQESVNGGFGDDVSVEAVAEVDRVDVVAIEILVSAFLLSRRWTRKAAQEVWKPSLLHLFAILVHTIRGQST